MPALIRLIATACAQPGPARDLLVPPPERPAVQAPAACARFEGGLLANGFPPPGSAEFCDSLDAFGDALSTTYDNLTNWLEGLDPMTVVANTLKLPEIALTAVPPIGALFNLWNLLVDRITDIGRWLFDRIKGVFVYLKDLHNCLTARCNSKASLAITLIRALVRSLEKVRTGIDPGVWLTTDIAVEFKLINNWLDHAERYYCPLNIPSPEEATEAWVLNRIEKKHRDCIWRLHGLNPDTYAAFGEVRRDQLDWREAVQFVRRRNGGPEDERRVLRDRGFTTDNDTEQAQEMFWELPTIVDHLHWLQRQVFDEEYVKRYRLLEGFDEKFWPAFGHDLTALGMRKEYAEKHFAAHWIMPSPEQMRQFVYRSDEIAAATGRPFTTDDFERILAEQDYNVLARGWFRATVYQIPAISYIKQMFQQDIIGPADLRTYHQRLGYSETDANRFAQIDELQKARMRASQTHGWTTSAANNALANKKITNDEHTQIFADLGYTFDEAVKAREVARITLESRVITRARTRVLSSLVTSMTQAIDVGIVSTDSAASLLERAGWPREMALAFAGAQSAVAGTKKIRQAVGYIRSTVIDGTISLPLAQVELGRLGLTAQSIQGYISLWTLQMTPRRKRRNADKIVDDVANHRVTTAQAIVRLRNLGYDDADTRLYLAEAQSKLTKLNQQRIAAQQKAGKARAKMLSDTIKAAQKVRKEALAALKKLESPTTLKKWAKLGIIGHDYFVMRFQQYGYDQAETERHYAEACAAKGAACTETTPEAQGVSGSGSGGAPPAK